MNKIFLLTGWLVYSVSVNGQETPDTLKSCLQQLTKPTRVLPKYVNFDVFKIFMIGHGRGGYGSIRYGTGFSFRMQLLNPYALWKYDFPIAWGVTFGSSKITAQSVLFGFDNTRLVAVTEDGRIENSMQRTSYFGITALKVIRVKPLAMTVLTGASAEYNLFSRLKIRTTDGNKGYSSGKYINRFSVPLHLQISVSHKQFVSCGVFGSYDMLPRFRGGSFNSLKQITAGLSLIALII